MDGALCVVRMDPPRKSVQTARACGNRIVRTLNVFSMNSSRNRYKIINNFKLVEQHRKKSLLGCNSIGLGVEGKDGSDGRKDSGDDPCFAPAYVSINNNKNPNCTVLEIEVPDYPGLLRVLAWVLNGLDVIAQNATLTTSSDGIAHNTIWLTTLRGHKLKDDGAELLAERVREVLTSCSLISRDENIAELSEGPITVSNKEDPDYTVLTVQDLSRTPGLLLEVASVLSGLQVEMRRGIIQGCFDCGDDAPQVLNDMPEEWKNKLSRVFKFWVKDRAGNKLHGGQIRTLLYALGLGLGFSSQKFPLSPPNKPLR